MAFAPTAALYFPTPHRLHPVKPVVAAYEPAPQGVHWDWPCALLYDPTAHGVQAAPVPEPGLYFPTAQLTQVSLLLAPTVREFLPAAQLWHAAIELEPVLGLNFPAGHAWHADSYALPALGLYFPVPQLAQALLRPPPPYVPASQLEHVLESDKPPPAQPPNFWPAPHSPQ